MGIRAGVTLKGAKGLRSALTALGDKMRGATKEGIYAVEKAVIKEAQMRVPVDTGALRRSGYYDYPQSSASGRYVIGELGFGRAFPTKQYALVQHERTDYEHTIGEAHYLLNAVYAIAPTARSIIAKHLKDGLRRR